MDDAPSRLPTQTVCKGGLEHLKAKIASAGIALQATCALPLSQRRFGFESARFVANYTQARRDNSSDKSQIAAQPDLESRGEPNWPSKSCCRAALLLRCCCYCYGCIATGCFYAVCGIGFVVH